MKENKTKPYLRAILVPKKITPTIFVLPCIYSCHKDADGNIVYLLRDWDDKGNYVELHPGQWLCQKTDQQWIVKDTL